MEEFYEKTDICIYYFCVACLHCSALLIGNTYYIDAEIGNDSASGTSESSAWKTLAFASEKTYSAGDKILLKAGSIFDGGFTAYGSGTAEKPIILGAYGDTDALGKPVIRSSDDIILLNINNVSCWVVENLELIAPNGKGIYITATDNVQSDDICVRNCCYDNYTKNTNCTVRYCLSVNDNKGDNDLAPLIFADGYNSADDEWPVSMDNFKFYNNTLINCSEIKCSALSNAVVANNIFVGKSPASSIQYMRKGVDKKGTFVSKFDGVFTNNCFWNMGVPPVSENNYFCNPKFVGTDETDKNSYILSAESKLLGSGIAAEDNMGEHDFYGNELTDIHNIGCYEGAGEKMQEKTGFFKDIGSFLGILLATVWGFSMNLSNTYWLF